MKRTIAAALLLVALVLGIFADLAIREATPGLSMFVWICGLTLGVVLVQRMAKVELVREWKWMASAAVLLGGVFLWRGSGALMALTLLTAGGAFILMGLRGARSSLAECGLLEYGHGALATTAHAAVGFPMLMFADMSRAEGTTGGAPRRTAEIVRGVAISLPVIFIIGSLFMGADAVFQQFVSSIFDIDLAVLFEHIFFTGFVTWVVSGYLRGMFIAKPAAFPYAQTKPMTLGITEVSIVLGSSILLFTLFMAVQFRYLFGGADLVQVTPSLTYAEYARRGFFELTTVVALVLPMLLVLDWLLRKDSASGLRLFRVLAIVQIILLFAVIVSAVQRMLLYQQEYGLTEPRVYATAFMGWLALLLIWYGLTVLSGRRSRFAIGAVGAAFLTLLVLVALNPDDLIARTNIARASEGKQMDARYLSMLSSDAVPALVEGFSTLDAKSRQAVAKMLLHKRERLATRDWRSWNWSSYAALRALSGHEEELQNALTE